MFTFVSGRISVSGKERRKMAKHIDRNAFLTKERTLYCKNCIRRTNSKGKTVYEIGEAPCRACGIGDVLDDLEDYPAADVVERKTGKWIFSYDHGGPNHAYFCSKCKRTIHTADLGDWSFCPNCGAKMIGGDDDV